MVSSKASATHSKVQELVMNDRFHEAFSILFSSPSLKSEPKLADLLKRQKETFKYLIHYLVEGYEDSNRYIMLDDIKANLYYINDSLLRNEIVFDSSDIYSSTLRFERIRKATLSSRLEEYKEAQSLLSLATEAGTASDVSKQSEEALQSLFNYVWTMFGSPNDDYKLLLNAVIDPNLPFEFKAQMISALFLGNMSYFDRNGINLLFDILESDIDEKLSARAMVCLVLLMDIHRQRFNMDPIIMGRLSMWQDSIITYRRLREVVMSIIRAHDTQRISSKMQNEVIPELMKLQPEILKRLGKISENTDLESLEANPEWEEIVNKNGLGDKLKELTDMQMDGGDVMMLAFSNLKSFPFFNTVSNWFIPFSNSHYEVAKIADSTFNGFDELLEAENVMCDSDKFSFIFSLERMPEQQRNMVNSQMQAQLSQFKEIMNDRRAKSSIPDFDQETTRFTRNLYRFFKLFRKKNDFIDPFDHPLDFITLPVAGEILSDEEILNLVSEFYFKRGYYNLALPLFLKIEGSNLSDASLWEKIGYCYNALGDVNQAITWYRKAELFNPDSLWLIKKLALCSRILKRYDDAAEYYAKALSKEPDNYQLLMNEGHSLLEAGKFEEALKNYYHADYIKPDRMSTLRAIAWTELLSGNLDKSLNIYNRILATDDKNATDLLNTGHVYFLKKDYKSALRSYIESASSAGNDIEKFEKAIIDDFPVIEKAGGNIKDLSLLIEKTREELKV